MIYELIKSLRCPILSIENLKLKIVSSQILQFARIVKAEVEIKYRVRCIIVFFLVRESKGQTLLIVLFGQLFTRAMRITFEHRDYRDMDTVFYDLQNRHICTVSIVSLTKRYIQSDPYQYTYIEDNHPEEENQQLVHFPGIILVFVTWASLRTQESRLRPGGPLRKQYSTK